MRLGHLVRDAGITGRELSARCGWHPAKTSRVLRAKAVPSDSDLRAWCTACGAEDQAADLIATARAVESMYLEWRRQHRDGMRRTQHDVLARNAAARLCRAYTSNVIPGFFQTDDYAQALMRSTFSCTILSRSAAMRQETGSWPFASPSKATRTGGLSPS
ncbi:Scr1 family TA system antitoxin-like transcriptional regulator [Streptomyces sp. NPDC050355]|uniref:Scr1 family TA system antitoxin-like transcriptional regulator n=1 Tax=Streptomyces sp. NPDC050355 TaxID=3365609 RepID=UPI00378B0F75